MWEPVVGANIVRSLLSNEGKAVEFAINSISIHYPTVLVDKYVVMPNHVHLLLFIQNGVNGNLDENGRTMFSPTTISRVIKHCKESVTKQIGYSLWQKSFYDHIIRDEADYLRVWEYIDENPANWSEDEYY